MGFPLSQGYTRTASQSLWLGVCASMSALASAFLLVG